MAKREYIVHLKADDKDVIQKAERCNGVIEKIGENEIKLAIDFDKADVGQIRDLVEYVANADPTLNIQLTYDMNLKSLETAMEKAKEYASVDKIIQDKDYAAASKIVTEQANAIVRQMEESSDPKKEAKKLKSSYQRLYDFVSLFGFNKLDEEARMAFLNAKEIDKSFSKAKAGDYMKYFTPELQEANNQVKILEGNLKRLEGLGAVSGGGGGEGPIKGIGNFVRSFDRLLELTRTLNDIEVPKIPEDASLEDRISQMQRLSDLYDATGEEVKKLQDVISSGKGTEETEDQLMLLKKYQVELAKAFDSGYDSLSGEDTRKLSYKFEDNEISNVPDELLSDVDKYQKLMGQAFNNIRKDGFGVLSDIVTKIGSEFQNLYETELGDTMRRIQEGAEAASSAAEESAEKMKRDSDATRENTEEHEKNREEKEKAEEQSSESSKDQGSGGTGTGSDEADEGAEKASKLAEAFEKVKTILDSIDASLKDVSMSLGSVDADAGLTNLISSLKTINDLLTQISGKDFNLIFNEADRSGGYETALEKEINKTYERYQRAYDEIMKAGQKYGMDTEGVLASIYGPDERRTGYSNISDFFERFSKSSLKDLDQKEYIARMQELIKYTKAARQETGNFYDDLKSLRLPTEDTQEIKRRFDNVVKQQQQQHANSIVEEALSKTGEKASTTLPDLSKIETALENISNIMTNLDASGFERMQAIAQELATSLQEIVDANQKVSSSAEETSSELSKESSSMDDVSSSGTKTASAKEDVKGANEKLGASADESSAKLDTEAKSLDSVNTKSKAASGIGNKISPFEKARNAAMNKFTSMLTDDLAIGVMRGIAPDLEDSIANLKNNDWNGLQKFTQDIEFLRMGITSAREVHDQRQKAKKEAEFQKKAEADAANKQRAEEEKLAASMAKAYEDTRRKNYEAQQDIQDYLKRSGEQAYNTRLDDRFRDRYVKQNFPELYSRIQNPELDNPDYAENIKKQFEAAKKEIQSVEKASEELNKEMVKFTAGGESGKAAVLMPDEFINAQLEYQEVMDNPNIFGMTKLIDNMKQQNAELEVVVNGQDVLWKKYQQTLAEVQQPGGLIDQHTAMFGNRAKDNQSLLEFTRANAAVDKNNADSMISVLNVVAKMKQEMSEADIAADKMATTMQRAYSLGNDISQKGMSDVLGNEISSIKQDLMAFDGSAEELEKFTTRLDDVDAKFKQVTENSDRYSQLLKDAFDVRNFVQGDTDLTRIFGDDNVGIIGALNDMFSSPEEAFTANGKQYLDDLETFVSTVKNSVHEAATGMDSDIDAFTKAMGTLYSGKNDYLKNLRMQATSKDGFDSIGKQIADYEAGIKSVSTLIDSMKAKWGENSDIVSNATKAFAKYQQDTTANMAQDIAKQAQQQIDKIDRAMKTRGEQGSGFMAEYAQRLDEAKTNAQDIVDALAHGTPPPDSSEWKTWLSTLESSKNTLKEINDQSNLLATQNQLSKLLTKVNQDIEKGAQYGQLGDSYAKLKSDVEGALSSLKSANDAGEALSKIEFRNFADAYQQLHATGVEIGAFKGTFLSKFSDAITNQSAQFLATYFSFQDMIRYGKEVVNTVVQTDSALTELKKVSDASNERIQQSFQTSAETAQELGSTITDVVNSTSDWARMGYSIDEAEQLAKVTTLFQTVGDNMTQETASQALVSTLKGFQMDADQAIDIVDKFNEVECCLAA